MPEQPKKPHGNKGKTRSPELRARISASLKGRKLPPEQLAKVRAAAEARRGKKRPPFSDEWRANMSKARRGKKLTPEHRAKIAEGLKGNKRGPRPDMRGDKNPMRRPEVRAKVSESQKGRPVPPERRARIAASLEGRTYPVGWGRPKKTPGYKGAHRRLDREYGPIKAQSCGVCGEPAKQWALLHEAAYTEVDGRGQRYSMDPTDYLAMCVQCHRRYDCGKLSL
jgi:hypothetical protein